MVLFEFDDDTAVDDNPAPMPPSDDVVTFDDDNPAPIPAPPETLDNCGQEF